ncbi:MAG: hypothetical protein HDS57_01160 [Barnesiella sp.]|nr:hypothetical protein [Barnesiella sp.]
MQSSPLEIALSAWQSTAPFRANRQRYKRYTYGRQWDDIITSPDGVALTEGAYAEKCGHRPLTNNLIRQMVKTVIGLWRRDMAPSHGGTDTAIARRNHLDELDARTLEEFLISGCAVQRVVTERRVGGTGVWVDPVSPSRFFFSPATDPRGCDMEVVGMAHDMSMREAMVRFGGEDGSRRKRVERIYSGVDSRLFASVDMQSVAASLLSAPAGRCRAIELWTLESRHMIRCYDPVEWGGFLLPASAAPRIEKENRSRAEEARIAFREFDTVRWHCRWLAPTGELLDSYDSPWPHGGHPFAVKLYPMTDGEIHPFVEDVIDQQRTINRLITMLDTMLGVSAKGALLFPLRALPPGYRLPDIAAAWSIPGAVIPFDTADTNLRPMQVSGSSGDCGAASLLSMEMKLFEQISGVNGAIQGREVTANTSAALFDARTRNATTALIDLLESFDSFVEERNRLIKES